MNFWKETQSIIAYQLLLQYASEALFKSEINLFLETNTFQCNKAPVRYDK